MPGIKFDNIVNKELASDTRLILAVQTALLPSDLLSTGFHRYPGYSALNVMREAGLWFGPRNLLEESPSFRQIIPYTVLVSQKDGGVKILAYSRTSAGGETRLHSKVSIGVGGHIDLTDARTNPEGRFDLDATIMDATIREITEELGEINDHVVYRKWAGIIIDNENPVGQVHIGMANVWYMHDRFDVLKHTKIEDSLTGVGFYTCEQLLDDLQLESWSRLMLNNIMQWM